LTLFVGWQVGHPACKKEPWDAGVVICLGRGADLHIAQLMPLLLIGSLYIWLTPKINTKPLIQSLKTGVKPFLGLDLV